MKKILLLILISAMSFAAACQGYADKADAIIISPTYPHFFGAAGEYANAAECFAEAGDNSSANVYFIKAAEAYILASDELVAGGDYSQRSLSLEYAGNYYVKSGQNTKAIDTYEKAVNSYETYGQPNNADVVAAKISALRTQKAIEFDPTLIIVLLFVFFMSAFSLVYLFIAKREFRNVFAGKERHEKRMVYHQEYQPLISRTADQFKSSPKIVREEPSIFERRVTPKERAIQKLRSKYSK